MNFTRRKEQAREHDRVRIENGEVTRDELQAQNSIIQMDLANDPEWKATRLRGAADSMNKRPPSLTERSHLEFYQEFKN